ncbi:MAG: prolyl oligopeptidase family serine peptidase, partial [Pseudomonadales bacterium]|nr:S9 family peptidase [Pseudomonadales bacterium]NIX07338.1 prolyl oligopeptidase family serine peptidase [Pseudomonadales bacterium]
GIKLNKQKAVEDYIAAAEWLVENEYTTKEKLVANGGSASGPLVGAALTQRPNLFGAVLIDIPLLDMVRYEESGIGSLWVSEFGSISDPKEFRALLDYSPYHNLEPGTCYPPILVTAGERDETALPWHAAKFTAALQHIEDCGHLALLQIVWGAGHTLGTSRHQSAKIYARQLAFLAEVLGLEAMVRTKEAAAR